MPSAVIIVHGTCLCTSNLIIKSAHHPANDQTSPPPSQWSVYCPFTRTGLPQVFSLAYTSHNLVYSPTKIIATHTWADRLIDHCCLTPSQSRRQNIHEYITHANHKTNFLKIVTSIYISSLFTIQHIKFGPAGIIDSFWSKSFNARIQKN